MLKGLFDPQLSYDEPLFKDYKRNKIVIIPFSELDRIFKDAQQTGAKSIDLFDLSNKFTTIHAGHQIERHIVFHEYVYSVTDHNNLLDRAVGKLDMIIVGNYKYQYYNIRRHVIEDNEYLFVIFDTVFNPSGPGDIVFQSKGDSISHIKLFDYMKERLK